MVIVELCLDVVVRLVSVYVLNNPLCSDLTVVAKADDICLVLRILARPWRCRPPGSVTKVGFSAGLAWVHQLVFPKTDFKR